VYHVELRQFPHNVNRFNLGDAELWAIVEPWVRERAFELGERKWSPQQARITILEGPHLTVQDLSLGRGWRLAQRKSEEVTARVLEHAALVVRERDAAAQVVPQRGASGPAAAAVQEAGEGPSFAAPAAPGGAPGTADPLAVGVELGALLGPDPARLLAAWRQIAARSSGLSPSEALALAEREIERSGGRR